MSGIAPPIPLPPQEPGFGHCDPNTSYEVRNGPFNECGYVACIPAICTCVYVVILADGAGNFGIRVQIESTIDAVWSGEAVWDGAAGSVTVPLCDGDSGCSHGEHPNGTCTVGGLNAVARRVPQGACCKSDGTCVNLTTREQCEGMGGAYVGDCTVCGDFPCDGVRNCCHPMVNRFAVIFQLPNVDQACNCQPLLCALDRLVFAPPDMIGPYITTENATTWCTWSGRSEGDCFDDTGHAVAHFILYTEMRLLHEGTALFPVTGRAQIQFTSGGNGNCIPPTWVFDGRIGSPLPSGVPCHGAVFNSLAGDCFGAGGTMTVVPIA